MSQNDISIKKANQQKKALLSALSSSLNPMMKELNQQKALQMPQLALRCAQFFHSISKYCVTYYNKFKDEQQVKKTKQIKKQQRDKKQKSNQRRGRKTKQQRQLTDSVTGAKLQPPKKPLTAYIIYFQDKKPIFVQRYPTLNLSQLTKLIAKQWKQLNQSDKQVYLDRASQDRKRYQQQMSQFKKFYGKGLLPIAQQQNIVQQKYQQRIIEQIINAQVPIQIQVQQNEKQKQEKNDEQDMNEQQDDKSQQKQIASQSKNDNEDDNDDNQNEENDQDSQQNQNQQQDQVSDQQSNKN